MNPQVKEKWIEALRSGEYIQDVAHLRTNSGYCCLGVLTDLYFKETGSPDEQWEPACGGKYYWAKGLDTTPPTTVCFWADISQNTEDVLIQMNDKEGRSFSEIADYIQENL